MIDDSVRIERAALYVHVPFCARKCGYCSFHSIPVSSVSPSTEDVVTATLRRGRILSRRFGVTEWSTAYIGGGTPTVLELPVLRELLSGVAKFGGGPGFREWTVEANPESLSPEVLRVFSGSGVTRVSLGVQSREAEALREAGRGATPDRIERALDLLSADWSGRFSVDLMIGLPGQTPVGVRSDIDRVTDAGASHVSIYELTLEEGTPLDARVRNGEIRPPEDAEAEELWTAAKEGCASAGLSRYEVSNWARPGEECLHNMGYWQGGAWIGIGPSAVSSVPRSGGGTLRIEEGRDHAAYVEDPDRIAREERISPATAAFEAIMMAFRTRDGVDERSFLRRFGVSLEELFGTSLRKWKDLIVQGPRGPAPSDRLMDILNAFLLDCMEELELTAPGRLDSSGGKS